MAILGEFLIARLGLYLVDTGDGAPETIEEFIRAIDQVDLDSDIVAQGSDQDGPITLTFIDAEGFMAAAPCCKLIPWIDPRATGRAG